MSKNGKRLFRDYDPYITSPFGYRIHPITNVKTFHQGVDYGTNNKNIATYALEDGKVVKTGYDNAVGKFVYVNYPRLKKNGIYQHLDSIKVVKDEQVTKDSIIGYTGATGAVTGIHLHFGWFKEEDQNKSWNDRAWEDFEDYDYPEMYNLDLKKVVRDEKKNQFQVSVTNLRVRDKPNGNILGYIEPGLYDVLDFQDLSDYKWCLLAKDNWVAYDKTFGKLYLKKQDEEENTEAPKNDETSSEEIEDSETPGEVKQNFFQVLLKLITNFLKKILKIS